ncbi:hypothetical protein [Amnibacterium kyonggiense]
MQGWSDFAVVIGGAAAALTGLLFVAVTLRIGDVGPSLALRSRAAQTLVLFTVIVVFAALLTAPQAPTAFAVETLVLGAIEAVALATLEHRARHGGRTPSSFEHFLEFASPNVIAPALLIVGAVLLLLGIEWAIALQAAAALLALAGGVSSAWAFIVRLGPSAR